MTTAFIKSAGAINDNTEIQSVTIPLVTTTTNKMVVVFVAMRSEDATVASVVDNGSTPNPYAQAASVVAHKEFDYSSDEYDKNPLNTDWVTLECWTGIVANAGTTLTVTVNGDCKFDVEALVYTSTVAGAFGVAGHAALAGTSAPTISLTTAASTSYVVAGFASPNGLVEATTTGTLRNQETGGTAQSVVSIACADATGATPQAVTMAPSNKETLLGEPGGQVTISVPSNYAVCAVEVVA